MDEGAQFSAKEDSRESSTNTPVQTPSLNRSDESADSGLETLASPIYSSGLENIDPRLLPEVGASLFRLGTRNTIDYIDLCYNQKLSKLGGFWA